MIKLDNRVEPLSYISQPRSCSKITWTPFWPILTTYLTIWPETIWKLWKSELCCFWNLILKRPQGQKYFYGRFHSLALLINHLLTQVLAEKKPLGTLIFLQGYKKMTKSPTFIDSVNLTHTTWELIFMSTF